MLSDTESFKIERNSLSIEVRTIEQASITTTNEFVGDSTDNNATFTFKPITPISVVSGRIEIKTPIWASQYLRKQIIVSYAMSDLSCISENFSKMSQKVSDGTITLEYEEYLG